jgi:Lipocalin-like domain
VTSAALVGSWKLLLVQVEMADTGQRIDIYGPSPVGRAILTESGYVTFVITARDRPVPTTELDGAGLFKSMMAYTGTYRIEDGNKLITTVDVSWHPGWVASEQARFFKLVGNVLSIRSARQTHPNFPGRELYGVLEWQREA